MPWKEKSVPLEDVAAELDIASAFATIDPASLRITVYGERRGSSVKLFAHLLYTSEASPTPDLGWRQEDTLYGTLAEVLNSHGNAPGDTTKVTDYSLAEGGRVVRHSFAVWKV